MRLTLLGTGNAAGMPVYGCECERCIHARVQKDLHRSPCSALLEVGERRYLIDAGQMRLAEKYPPGTLDGIFITHFHPDHVQGLFHLRWGKGIDIPVYCPPDTHGCADLYKHSGILGFLPQQKFVSFMLEDLTITPVPLIHSKLTFGYVFEYQGDCLAYLTDTKGLPPNTQQWLATRKIDQMIIDTSFPPGVDKNGHNNLDQTIELHQAIGAQRTVLTHIGHDLDLWLANNQTSLPESVIAGADGQVIFSCSRSPTTPIC